MIVYTEFGPAEIGPLTGTCYFRDNSSCANGRYYVTNRRPDGTYDDDFYWMKKGKTVVGVCVDHALKLASEGWEFLGKGKFTPVGPDAFLRMKWELGHFS